ncbi:MAG: hypothetical protein AAF532_02830 [Planctomycetota bacterium]
MSGPRTWDYFVLRACERFGRCESWFRDLDYTSQVRLLAYETLRAAESGLSSVPSTRPTGR